MVVDVSGISYFAPILAFLIVFIILFALLNKTKLIGENAFFQIFVSFVIATVFVSAAGVREYVLTITPWFALLVVSLFFILFVIGFVGKPVEGMAKGIGIFFVIVLIIIFLVSGFVVFSDFIVPYLPGGTGEGADPALFRLSNEFYTSRVFGAVLLLGIGIFVSWILSRSGKKKD